ncbi:MAG: TatD family hydrolase [Kiritimatiellia bacterium]|jgi:TatD DNase family protein|nr:TatD family hydrolase [Kiritimatiellia bacterium]
MRLFDAHTHLHDARLTPVLDAVIRRAAEAGVTGLCSCGTAPADWADAAALAERAGPCRVVTAFGAHPWFAAELPENWPEQLEAFLLRHADAPVGEIGLDGVRREIPAALQEEVFVRQLGLAARLGRPVVLHGARAWEKVLLILKPYAARLPGILAHGFGGSAEQLARLLELGGHVSLCGTVCNPEAATVRAVARRVPGERLLLETDSPDLLPRTGLPAATDPCGKPLNQPSNLTRVCETVAALRGLDPPRLAEQTRANALSFFRCAPNPEDASLRRQA